MKSTASASPERLEEARKKAEKKVLEAIGFDVSDATPENVDRRYGLNIADYVRREADRQLAGTEYGRGAIDGMKDGRGDARLAEKQQTGWLNTFRGFSKKGDSREYLQGYEDGYESAVREPHLDFSVSAKRESKPVGYVRFAVGGDKGGQIYYFSCEQTLLHFLNPSQDGRGGMPGKAYVYPNPEKPRHGLRYAITRAEKAANGIGYTKEQYARDVQASMKDKKKPKEKRIKEAREK